MFIDNQQEIEKQLKDIILKYDISLLVTFGSYNTDRFTQDSDIDTAFISKRKLMSNEKLHLLEDLVFYFRRDRIDLVDLSKSEPLLSYEIACNSRIIYEENSSYLFFKLKASSRYADTKSIRGLRKAYLMEQTSLM